MYNTLTTLYNYIFLTPQLNSINFYQAVSPHPTLSQFPGSHEFIFCVYLLIYSEQCMEIFNPNQNSSGLLTNWIDSQINMESQGDLDSQNIDEEENKHRNKHPWPWNWQWICGYWRQKHEQQKEKEIKWASSKFNFCLSNDIIKKVKIQHTEYEKIFWNYVCAYVYI